jgi:hypothetical protein
LRLCFAKLAVYDARVRARREFHQPAGIAAHISAKPKSAGRLQVILIGMSDAKIAKKPSLSSWLTPPTAFGICQMISII